MRISDSSPLALRVPRALVLLTLVGLLVAAIALPATTSAGGARTHGGGKSHATTVTAINGTVLTLRRGDGSTQNVNTAGLVLTAEGQTITIATFRVGDVVKLHSARPAAGAAKVLSGIRLILPRLKGTVNSLGAGSFGLLLRDGSTRTIAHDAGTAFKLNRVLVNAGWLTVGHRVEAFGRSTGATTFAALIVKIKADKVRGTVSAKTATTITLTRPNRPTVIVNVSGLTVFHVKDVTSATLANVAIGAKVSATGIATGGGTLNATRVKVHSH